LIPQHRLYIILHAFVDVVRLMWIVLVLVADCEAAAVSIVQGWLCLTHYSWQYMLNVCCCGMGHPTTNVSRLIARQVHMFGVILGFLMGLEAMAGVTL
jgi:hypothetical protein